MNAQPELARQQLQAIADHLMVQFGSVLFISLAYVLIVLTLVAVILNFRKTALFLFIMIGVATFLVPTPLTLIFSPIIVVAASAGLIWGILRPAQRAGFPPNGRGRTGDARF